MECVSYNNDATKTRHRDDKVVKEGKDTSEILCSNDREKDNTTKGNTAYKKKWKRSKKGENKEEDREGNGSMEEDQITNMIISNSGMKVGDSGILEKENSTTNRELPKYNEACLYSKTVNFMSGSLFMSDKKEVDHGKDSETNSKDSHYVHSYSNDKNSSNVYMRTAKRDGNDESYNEHKCIVDGKTSECIDSCEKNSNSNCSVYNEANKSRDYRDAGITQVQGRGRENYNSSTNGQGNRNRSDNNNNNNNKKGHKAGNPNESFKHNNSGYQTARSGLNRKMKGSNYEPVISSNNNNISNTNNSTSGNSHNNNNSSNKIIISNDNSTATNNNERNVTTRTDSLSNADMFENKSNSLNSTNVFEQKNKEFVPQGGQYNFTDNFGTDSPKVPVHNNQMRKNGRTMNSTTFTKGSSSREFKSILNVQLCKTKMCPYMNTKEKCKRFSNNMCPYAHDKSELKPIPNLYKTAMCRNFIKNLCFKSKKECKFAHHVEELRSTDEFYKTTLCKFYINGYCKADKNCRHAHGYKELKTRPSSIYMNGNKMNSNMTTSNSTAGNYNSVSTFTAGLGEKFENDETKRENDDFVNEQGEVEEADAEGDDDGAEEIEDEEQEPEAKERNLESNDDTGESATTSYKDSKREIGKTSFEKSDCKLMSISTKDTYGYFSCESLENKDIYEEKHESEETTSNSKVVRKNEKSQTKDLSSLKEIAKNKKNNLDIYLPQEDVHSDVTCEKQFAKNQYRRSVNDDKECVVSKKSMIGLNNKQNAIITTTTAVITDNANNADIDSTHSIEFKNEMCANKDPQEKKISQNKLVSADTSDEVDRQARPVSGRVKNKKKIVERRVSSVSVQNTYNNNNIEMLSGEGKEDGYNTENDNTQNDDGDATAHKYPEININAKKQKNTRCYAKSNLCKFENCKFTKSLEKTSDDKNINSESTYKKKLQFENYNENNINNNTFINANESSNTNSCQESVNITSSKNANTNTITTFKNNSNTCVNSYQKKDDFDTCQQGKNSYKNNVVDKNICSISNRSRSCSNNSNNNNSNNTNIMNHKEKVQTNKGVNLNRKKSGNNRNANSTMTYYRRDSNSSMNAIHQRIYKNVGVCSTMNNSNLNFNNSYNNNLNKNADGNSKKYGNNQTLYSKNMKQNNTYENTNINYLSFDGTSNNKINAKKGPKKSRVKNQAIDNLNTSFEFSHKNNKNNTEHDDLVLNSSAGDEMVSHKGVEEKGRNVYKKNLQYNDFSKEYDNERTKKKEQHSHNHIVLYGKNEKGKNGRSSGGNSLAPTHDDVHTLQRKFTSNKKEKDLKKKNENDNNNSTDNAKGTTRDYKNNYKKMATQQETCLLSDSDIIEHKEKNKDKEKKIPKEQKYVSEISISCDKSNGSTTMNTSAVNITYNNNRRPMPKDGTFYSSNINYNRTCNNGKKKKQFNAVETLVGTREPINCKLDIEEQVWEDAPLKVCTVCYQYIKSVHRANNPIGIGEPVWCFACGQIVRRTSCHVLIEMLKSQFQHMLADPNFLIQSYED